MELKAAGGTASELLAIEYLGGDKLFLPVDRLSRVQRYGASDGVKPRIDKLGGETWEKVRGKVKASLRNMAGESCSRSTRRASSLRALRSPGAIARSRSSKAASVSTETAGPDGGDRRCDRRHAASRSRWIDSVCGDVGYGKTEVAIRAAFRAAQDGKQVVVLTPTTVLCQQHFENFQKRYEDHPIRVDMLSRFCTPKEAQAQPSKGSPPAKSTS